MGIFKSSDPIAAAAAELSAVEKRERRMRERLAAATTALESARAARRDLLLNADDDGADDELVEHIDDDEITAGEERVRAFADALGELVARREGAERTLAAAREAVERARVAEMMAATNAEIERGLAAFQRSASNLLAALDKLAMGGRPVGATYRPFVEGMIGDIGRLLAAQHQRQAGVAAGQAPLPGIVVAAPTAAPAPAIERIRVWTQQRVMWREPDGSTAYALKYAMIPVPAATARKAIAMGAAMAADDPRIPTLTATYGIAAQAPSISPLPDALNLDALNLDALDDDELESGVRLTEAINQTLAEGAAA